MSIKLVFSSILVGLLVAVVLFVLASPRLMADRVTGSVAAIETASGGAEPSSRSMQTPTRTAARSTAPVSAGTGVRATPASKPAEAGAPARVATTVPPPTPIVPSSGSSARLTISKSDLESEVRKALNGSGAPIRDPSLQLVPSDRVGLQGNLPVSVFQVPVTVEARLQVENGAVKVKTTRVEAVGATLPSSVADELGRRFDDEGSQAIAAALPRGTTARSVEVQPEQVIVELALG